MPKKPPKGTLDVFFQDEPTPRAAPGAAPAPPAVRPGTPIGPPAPSARDLPDYYSLLGQGLAAGLHGFLQGIPQGITAARNFLTQPNPPPPKVPPVGAPPPALNLNFMGGLPVGALAGSDLSGAADAFLSGYQSPEPPVPHAVRNLLGEGPAQKAADYALDFMQPETGAIVGPAYEATFGRGLGKAIQAGKAILSPALKTALGDLLSSAGHAFGAGPTSQMMREATKPYETKVSIRLQEAGQIAREMAEETRRLRIAAPAFDAAVKALPAGDPGPLQRLAQKYATLNLQHGPQALPTSIDNQAIALRAQQAGVPYALVKQYGDRLLSHMQQTIADLYAAGATPFIKARGTQFQVPQTPPAGAWYKNPYFAATPVSAKPIAEDRLRRRFASAYLDQLFAAEKPQVLGQVGAAAYTGSGIKEVRRAGLRDLVNQLTDPNNPLSRYVSGVYQPGTVQVAGRRDFGAALSGKFLPETLYRYLASEIGQAGLIGPAGQKVYTKFGRQVGPLYTRAEQAWNAIGTPLEKIAGLQKKLWIGNFSTAASNIASNQAAVELAARREGFPVAQFMAELPAATAEVAGYKKTGVPSADIRGLMQTSRAFIETQASTAALAGKKGVKEVAGLSGRVVTLPGGKRVLLPPAQELASRAGGALASLHDVPEKVYKLALYKTLAPQVGSEQAGKLVEKYLFDYSDRGYLLEALDRYGAWVFNAFPTKAAGLLIDTLIHRPDLVARYPRLQAQLMAEVPGSKARYQGLPSYAQGQFVYPTAGGSFLDFSRQHVFGDALKAAQETADAARQGRLPDYLSLDALANLPGHTAASPLLSAMQNRQFYGSAAHPVTLSHPGAPAERQVVERAAGAAYQMLPGFVGTGAKYLAAKAGVPPYQSLYAEPKKPADVLVQGLLGVRTIPGETRTEQAARLKASPDVAANLQATREYATQAQTYLRAHPELNRYRPRLQAVGNQGEVMTQFRDAVNYLQSLAAGPLSPEKKGKLDDAVARVLALEERARQLGVGRRP